MFSKNQTVVLNFLSMFLFWGEVAGRGGGAVGGGGKITDNNA